MHTLFGISLILYMLKLSAGQGFYKVTSWVSSTVVVSKKEGGVAIRVDMWQANKAIRRVRYPQLIMLVLPSMGKVLYPT